MVFYHISTTGGHRIVKYFGLFGGKGNVANLFKFKPAGILATNEVKVTYWDTLKKVMTTAEIEYARDSNMNPFSSPALWSPHPSLP